MTLYVFDKDSLSMSACTGGCLEKWPPLTVADASAALTGKWASPAALGTITRGRWQRPGDDINGMPLYYYYEDKQAGDTKGQAVGDVCG